MTKLVCWNMHNISLIYWLVVSTTFLSRCSEADNINEDVVDWNKYDVIHPQKLSSAGTKRSEITGDLSTKAEGKHEKEAQFFVKAFGKKHKISLALNQLLISPEFLLRYFKNDGSEVVKVIAPENCYYQGKVDGKNDSMVTLNTCHGLKGFIDDGEARIYIEPHGGRSDGAHKVYRVEQRSQHQERACGFSYHGYGTVDRNSSWSRGGKSRVRERREIDEFYRKYLTITETRYVELVLVADNALFKNFGSNMDDLTERLVTLSNAVDAIYSRINIRIILVGVEIWTNKDKVPRKSDISGPLLVDFEKYRKNVLRKRFGHDNAQLLCNDGWTDAAGLAQLYAMCKPTSSSIVAWNHDSIVGPWIASAHEMGHNFGMEHDEEIGHCTCLTPRGCIMGGHKTRIAGFSDCSLEALQKLDDFCLYNLPAKEFKTKCGNGVLEDGEECDCGNEQKCKESDSCCEPIGCKLKKGSQCSDVNHGCCKDCLFKPQFEVCRASKGHCDVPEYCTGDSGECPKNEFRRNGDPCGGEKQAIQGVVRPGQQHKYNFNPPITASQIRINPRYWSYKMCLTTELYGCSGNDVNQGTKTPLASGKFCIQPQNGSCRPRDGATLVYTNTGDCDQESMQFTLSADGLLRHACSNMLICPQNSRNDYNTVLILSRRCSREQAKFERTKGGSIKHVSSGFCVHPYQGDRNEGTKLCIYPGCDEERLRIDFLRQDCILPLGMANGRIKDSQITASSYINDDSLPKYARLIQGNKKAWCGTASKDQYLQIDLTRTTTVTSIMVSGLGWNLVQGYFVFYSQDGQQWTEYTEKRDSPQSELDSYCYMGKCAHTRSTQCKELWGPGASSAHEACYNKYNKQGRRYGTCDPTTRKPCRAQDVQCGQLQCLEKLNNRPVVDYGTDYQRLTLPGGQQCSVASLKQSDYFGLGMVQEGTTCGTNKMCIGYRCQSVSLKSCPKVNGKECAGNGVCSNDGKCVCIGGYDPDTSCRSELSPVDGNWGTWSDWTECSRVCNGGTRRRFRFCDNPSAKNGGKFCQGDRVIEEDCNTDECPEAHSCRHLKQIGKSTNRNFKSNIYKINPDGKGAVMTYCDMLRDGGGWTLLVTSHTNTWTRDSVKRKNEMKPDLKKDYSILFKADDIKDSINVKGTYFEYRLEANKFGHWGGIWKAPRGYTFLGTDNSQTDVDLIKKFDDWKYAYASIEKRMPYLYNERLTVAADPKNSIYGSITANLKEYHPAPWIWGKEKETQPAYIWYWVREGEYEEPSSCMEILTRSFSKTAAKDHVSFSFSGEYVSLFELYPYSCVSSCATVKQRNDSLGNDWSGKTFSRSQEDGIYTLRHGRKQVQTYCDMSRNGGAWTLLLTSANQGAWSRNNIIERNPDKPSLNTDFSILGNSDAITKKEGFQYRIEADGNDMWGGIWEARDGYSLSSSSSEQSNIHLLQKFGDWDDSTENLNKRVPFIRGSVTYSTSSTDSSGTILSTSRRGEYIKNGNPKPRFIRIWVREGTSRSCNEIKVRGERKGETFMDGFYMIKLRNNQIYLPVHCDMTSEPSAYTLLVTSAHGNWRVSDVKSRNINIPSLINDYSILGFADSIKDISASKTFKYKLEANQRGTWGGVWEAPTKYSFIKTDNTQTNVRLIKRLGQWKTNKDSIQNRMPYLGHSKTLLTTNENPNWYGPGGVITDSIDQKPAVWIYPDMYSPGVIWYWLNEDDCDASRKPVHGGVSGWSSWSECDQLCKPGKQRRQKLCDNPKPRCGGDPCDVKMMAEEIKGCNVCPESPIRTSNGLCVQPQVPGCNFRDGTALVYSQNSRDCSMQNQAFVYDGNGVLRHKCSGKYVCPKGGNDYWFDAKLVLSSNCDEDKAKFIRTRGKSLKHAFSGMCVHPQGGVASSGAPMLLWDTCDEKRLIHDLFKL